MTKRKRKKLHKARSQLAELKHGLTALAKHVDGIHHRIAAMERSMDIAGKYLMMVGTEHHVRKDRIS